MKTTNGADTVWIIMATALVLFMTLRALARFYGGLVRTRNVQITPLRVDKETKTNGLERSVHGERAYDLTS